MKKAAEAFRSIGEVSQLVGVAPHVLRYWESQFPLFTPVKRRDGRRYFRPDDVRLAAGLCEILREEGVTIRGAKSLMAADRGAALRARGAARLGGIFAEDAGAESAPPTDLQTGSMPPAPATAEAAPAPEGAPATRIAPKRRRAEDAATLPLFPEFGGADRDSPKRTDGPARPTAGAAAAEWLPRLQDLRAGLRHLPRTPALRDRAAGLHARLLAARAKLAG